jgi:hypothetical protein
MWFGRDDEMILNILMFLFVFDLSKLSIVKESALLYVALRPPLWCERHRVQ